MQPNLGLGPEASPGDALMPEHHVSRLKEAVAMSFT